MNVLVCVAIAIALTASPSSASIGLSSTPEIVGTILDSNGKPAAGVPISVNPIPSGPSFITVSKKDGTFALAAIPPGAYGISVETQTACAFSDAIGVAIGYTTFVHLRLTDNMCNGISSW